LLNKRKFSAFLTLFALMAMVGLFLLLLNGIASNHHFMNLNADRDQDVHDAMAASERALAALKQNIHHGGGDIFEDLQKEVSLVTDSEHLSNVTLKHVSDGKSLKEYSFPAFSENPISLAIYSDSTEFYVTVATGRRTFVDRQLTESGAYIEITTEDWEEANTSGPVFGEMIITVESKEANGDLGVVSLAFIYNQTDSLELRVIVTEMGRVIVTRRVKVTNGMGNPNTIDLL